MKGGAIEVIVKDGAVTLKGTVEEDKQKNKAEKIAKKVNGVKSVNNEITARQALTSACHRNLAGFAQLRV